MPLAPTVAALLLALVVLSSVPPANSSSDTHGAAVNPTGDPIGGGWGYRRVVTRSSARYVASTASDLLRHLNSALPGEIVYVDDSATIDLTGLFHIPLGPNVTLASGRGTTQGAEGGTIAVRPSNRSSATFVTSGVGVRVTGLRMVGFDPEIGDEGMDLGTPEKGGAEYTMCVGVLSNKAGFEVDNCELTGWSLTGVSIYPGSTGALVHHNWIHEGRRAGFGYGVEISGGTATISANVMDACRHCVASEGVAGISWTAEYNVILPMQVEHAFDRHGTGSSGDGGDGGDYTIVRYNTVLNPVERAVFIRGMPTKTDGVQVYGNWFAHATEAEAVGFKDPSYATRSRVENNVYGSTVPVGNEVEAMPVTASPSTVCLGAAVSLTAGGTGFWAYRWDFGDGETARGKSVQHTFSQVGRYLVKCTGVDLRGLLAVKRVPVTVKPTSTTRPYWLSAWVKDGYRGELYGLCSKRILVNDAEVWKSDAAGDQGWEHAVVDVTDVVKGQSTATVVLKALFDKAVPSPTTTIISYRVYFDDVTLFGSILQNGDFENQTSWTRTSAGSDWEGGNTLFDSRSGDRSFNVRTYYAAPSTAGAYSQIKQTVGILASPDTLCEPGTGSSSSISSALHSSSSSSPLPKSSVQSSSSHAQHSDTSSSARCDSLAPRIGWWHFDEGTGSSAYDSSGNGLTVAITGAPGIWQPGMRGTTGLRFVSGGAARAVVTAEALKGLGDFSVELWLRFDSFGQYEIPVTNKRFELMHRGDWVAGKLFWLGNLPDETSTSPRGDSSWLDQTGVVTPKLAQGSWTHVVGVVSGTTMQVFVNGNLTRSLPCLQGQTLIVPTSGTLTLGDGKFDGMVDEVAVYGRGLTASEVAAAYRGTSGNDCTKSSSTSPVTLALWRFEEKSGTSAADSSGHGLTGTYTGMTERPWTTGIKGGALNFLSAGSVVAQDPSRVLAVSGDMTMTLWIKFAAFQSSNIFVQTGLFQLRSDCTAGSVSCSSWSFLVALQDSAAKSGDSRFDGWGGSETTKRMYTKRWYHIAAVVSGSESRIFVNGELARATASGVALPRGTSRSGDVVIGRVSGIIDEVSITNKALSPEDIKTQFLECSSLVDSSSLLSPRSCCSSLLLLLATLLVLF